MSFIFQAHNEIDEDKILYAPLHTLFTNYYYHKQYQNKECMMDVTSTSQMQQMQMRKMDGSGGGQGQGGMKSIMQNLSTEDKNRMIEQLSSMSQEERTAAVSKMKEVDASTMSTEDYTKTLFVILDKKSANEDKDEGFSVYA